MGDMHIPKRVTVNFVQTIGGPITDSRQATVISDDKKTITLRFPNGEEFSCILHSNPRYWVETNHQTLITLGLPR